jgi:cell division septum initiation protein DivIVA
MGLLDIINSITGALQKGVSAVDSVNYTVSSARNSVSNAKQAASEIKQSIKPDAPRQAPEVSNTAASPENSQI